MQFIIFDVHTLLIQWKINWIIKIANNIFSEDRHRHDHHHHVRISAVKVGQKPLHSAAGCY